MTQAATATLWRHHFHRLGDKNKNNSGDGAIASVIAKTFATTLLTPEMTPETTQLVIYAMPMAKNWLWYWWRHWRWHLRRHLHVCAVNERLWSDGADSKALTQGRWRIEANSRLLFLVDCRQSLDAWALLQGHQQGALVVGRGLKSADARALTWGDWR